MWLADNEATRSSTDTLMIAGEMKDGLDRQTQDCKGQVVRPQTHVSKLVTFRTSPHRHRSLPERQSHPEKQIISIARMISVPTSPREEKPINASAPDLSNISTCPPSNELRVHHLNYSSPHDIDIYSKFILSDPSSSFSPPHRPPAKLQHKVAGSEAL